MTPYEHYVEAERLLDIAALLDEEDERLPPALAKAEIHAILALFQMPVLPQIQFTQPNPMPYSPPYPPNYMTGNPPTLDSVFPAAAEER